MKRIKLISIVCPVYNASDYLRETICSIIEQTNSNWELILVDDGSEDDSGTICDEFAFKDKRIRVFHKNNSGQMNARISGIKESSGDYIMFLDSDDTLNKDAIEKMHQQIEKNLETDVFLFNGKIFPIDSNSKTLPFVFEDRLFRTKKDIIEYTFCNQMFGYLWMYCFKKDLLDRSIKKDTRFLNVRYTEDAAFIYNALLESESLCAIKSTFYNYRRNEKSITNNLTNEDRRDRFRVFDYIYSDLYSKFKGVKFSNEISIMLSWSIFSYVQHIDDKKVFKSAFIEIRNSFLFKKICKNTKCSNKQFILFKMFIFFNLPSFFYLIKSREKTNIIRS